MEKKEECSIDFCANWLDELEDVSKTKRFENCFTGEPPDPVDRVHIDTLCLLIGRMIMDGFPKDVLEEMCMDEITESVKNLKEFEKEEEETA